MKMLRARRGKTSSEETFWLMAAMRMKDRKGPGMATVSAEDAAGDAVGVAAQAEKGAHTQKRAAKEKANVRIRHFIIGYPWRTLSFPINR